MQAKEKSEPVIISPLRRWLHRGWRIPLVAGLLVALLTSTGVTIMEWLENPGGIFHDASGTRWRFVYETYISWFIPTWITTSGICLLLSLGLTLLHHYHLNKPDRD